MAKTYNTLYLESRKKLRAAEVYGAQIEAREIVAFAAGKNREQFYRDMNLYASDDICRHVEELTERRLEGEPVAYIIGEWEFYGLPFDVSKDVLIPRMDTEILAEQAISEAKKIEEKPRVLDLCSGSGCVGIAVAANVENARVILTDISEGALRVCRQNVRRNELSYRVSCIKVDVRIPVAPSMGEFDVITCNPPYIPTEDIAGLDSSVKDYEPLMALDGGTDGLDFYRCVCDGWKKALKPGGVMLLEVGIDQASSVEEIMRKNGFVDIRAFPDTQGILRVVSGRRSLE